MSTNTTILLAALILGVAIVAATAIATNDDTDATRELTDAPTVVSRASAPAEAGPALRGVTADNRISRLEEDLQRALAEIRRLSGDASGASAADGPAVEVGKEFEGARDRFFQLKKTYAEGAATEEQVAELMQMSRDKAFMAQIAAGLTATIESDPTDLEARMQLVEVKTAQIHNAESITERSLLGRGVGEQLDAILERDPEHWDGRFMRAVGISHSQRTPQGRALAIKEFESLIALQQSKPTDLRFAQTYAELASVYLAERSTDKARATIEAGLARYPDDPALKKQLESLDTER